MKKDYWATQRERKGWTYGVGDMIYVVDDDNKLREIAGEPVFGVINKIDGLLVTVNLNTSFGGEITVSIDDVWRVSEGPIQAEEEHKEKLLDRFDLEQEIMSCWQIVDDLKYIKPKDYESSVAIDGLQALYTNKFDSLFKLFETLIKEGKIR